MPFKNKRAEKKNHLPPSIPLCEVLETSHDTNSRKHNTVHEIISWRHSEVQCVRQWLGKEHDATVHIKLWEICLQFHKLQVPLNLYAAKQADLTQCWLSARSLSMSYVQCWGTTALFVDDNVLRSKIFCVNCYTTSEFFLAINVQV